jgi:hypothetical protein
MAPRALSNAPQDARTCNAPSRSRNGRSTPHREAGAAAIRHVRRQPTRGGWAVARSTSTPARHFGHGEPVTAGRSRRATTKTTSQARLHVTWTRSAGADIRAGRYSWPCARGDRETDSHSPWKAGTAAGWGDRPPGHGRALSPTPVGPPNRLSLRRPLVPAQRDLLRSRPASAEAERGARACWRAPAGRRILAGGPLTQRFVGSGGRSLLMIGTTARRLKRARSVDAHGRRRRASSHKSSHRLRRSSASLRFSSKSSRRRALSRRNCSPRFRRRSIRACSSFASVPISLPPRRRRA